MGFECVFHYFDKNEDGKGFNTANRKTFKKVIGKMDDVPLEELAGLVLKQLARRDVLVDEVELFEFTRKPLSFRETKGGIVIKGQKFDLDGTKFEAVPEVIHNPREIEDALRGLRGITSPMVYPQNSESAEPQIQSQPTISLRERLGMGTPSVTTADNGGGSIIRMEIFDPDDEGVVNRLKTKGMEFVSGKKYPIFKETTKTMTVRSETGVAEEQETFVYTVNDEQGKSCTLPSSYFRPATAGLTFMPPELNQSRRNNNNGAKLLHMNNQGPDMPVLRRGF